MKKFLFGLTVLGIFVGVGAALAGPDIGIGGSGVATQIADKSGYTTTGITDTSLSEIIGRVVRVVLGLVGTIFLVLTIYSGILWMTAAGNEEQVTKALNILKASVIGLIITLAAYGITAFVLFYTAISTGQHGGTPSVGGGSATSGAGWVQWSDKLKAPNAWQSLKSWFSK